MVISILDRDGFEARHIITFSSHISEATIKDYSTKHPDDMCKEMFNSLLSTLVPQLKKDKTKAVASAGKIQDQELTVNDTKENLPTFDLDLINDFDTIDISIFANLVYDNNPITNHTDSNAFAIANPQNTPQLLNTQTINNTQVNAIKTTPQNLPCLPQMYFPHSTVTINYNYNLK